MTDNSDEHQRKEWRETGATHRVAGLLREDLCRRDHSGVAVQLLRKIDHLIRSVLLSARVSGREQVAKGIDSNSVALGTTSGGILGHGN